MASIWGRAKILSLSLPPLHMYRADLYARAVRRRILFVTACGGGKREFLAADWRNDAVRYDRSLHI